MCIKFESEEISITGDYCSRSDSKRKMEEKVLSFVLPEDEVIRKGKRLINCQQGEGKLSYSGFVTAVINIIIIVLGRVDVFILVFVLCVIAFHKSDVAMLRRLCIFSKFCKGVY